VTYGPVASLTDAKIHYYYYYYYYYRDDDDNDNDDTVRRDVKTRASQSAGRSVVGALELAVSAPCPHGWMDG